MNCARLCLLCEKPKKEFVNYSKFHGTCGAENLYSKNLIKCIHCSSIVPIMNIQPEPEIESFLPFPQKTISVLQKSFKALPMEFNFYKPTNIKAETIKSNIPHRPPDKASREVVRANKYPGISNNDSHPGVKSKFEKIYDETLDIEEICRDSAYNNQLIEGKSITSKSERSKNQRSFLSRYYCTIIVVLIVLSLIVAFIIITST